MLSRSVCCFLLMAALGRAQDAEAGIAMPVTLSAGGLFTHRLQSVNPKAESRAAAFRAMLYPSVRLSRHWYGFAAVQVQSDPYFYEQANYASREVRTNVLQAYMAYSRSSGNRSFTFKAGQMSSAFGSFLQRYDDAANPLIDLPISYGYYYKPVGVYGLAGAQLDVAWNRADARLQFANSAPGNPQNLRSKEQHPQWAGGAGYTIARGLRVGGSLHHGPYMNRDSRWLRPGEFSKDWHATGAGLDVQWARGRFSANGEWAKFWYPYPRVASAIGAFGYGELKVVLTPRLFVAGRAAYNKYDFYFTSRQTGEAAFGYHLNRMQLLKAGYLTVHGDKVRGSLQNVLGVQFVTSISSLSRSWR